MKDSQQVKDMTEELINAPIDSKLAEMTREHDEVEQKYLKMLETIKLDSELAETTRAHNEVEQKYLKMLETIKLKEQEEEEREAKAEQAARDLLATKEARHKAEDRLRAEECERKECEALERTIAEIEELRENRSGDLRTVEDKTKASKCIRDTRELIEAETARILRDNDIIAEKKLAEDKLRAEECYRKKCAALERKIEKTEELKKLRDGTLLMEKKLLSLKEKPPGEASRDSWTEGLDEREMEEMSEIENLTEEFGPEIVYSKYNAPWSMGSMLVMLGMVYMVCTGVPGSVGTAPMEGMSTCLMSAPRYITAQHPISWKVTEAVGTVAWCTWEELKDPGYQDT
jgi:hypothetical protein